MCGYELFKNTLRLWSCYRTFNSRRVTGQKGCANKSCSRWCDKHRISPTKKWFWALYPSVFLNYSSATWTTWRQISLLVTYIHSKFLQGSFRERCVFIKEAFFFQHAEEIQLEDTVSGLHSTGKCCTKYIAFCILIKLQCVYMLPQSQWN